MFWECFGKFSETDFKNVEKKEERGKSYHAGILRGSFHEAWYCGVQTSQQLGVDGRLEEAVEVLAVREAHEVMAMTSRYWHRQHNGVQQQVHQLLTLKRNINTQQEAAGSETL